MRGQYILEDILTRPPSDDESIDKYQSLRLCAIGEMRALIDALIQTSTFIGSLPDRKTSGKMSYECVDKLTILRHDIFHVLIAFELGANSRELPIHQVVADLFGIIFEGSKKNQTPDIVRYYESENKLLVADVAVSASANHVSSLKVEKYSELIRELKLYLPELTIVFEPVVLDQGCNNVDIILSRVDINLAPKMKQMLRELINMCNELVSMIRNSKLSEEPKEREIYSELENRFDDKGVGSIVHPLPSPESIDCLRDKYPKAFEKFPDLDHEEYLNGLADRFKELTTEETLFSNQILEYPSAVRVKKSFTLMEDQAKNEFTKLSKPKPSLHFMIGLSESKHVTGDGKLDSLQVTNLQNLFETCYTDGPSSNESLEMFTFLKEFFAEVPNPDDPNVYLPDLEKWNGKKKVLPGDKGMIKSRLTINGSLVNKHKAFFEKFVGLNKKEKDRPVTGVDSLPFWDEEQVQASRNFMSTQALLLSGHRKSYKAPEVARTNMHSIDYINKLQEAEMKDAIEEIQGTQALYLAKQISAMCQSLLIQKKRECNNIQILNKGDRGFYVMTLPHKLLDSRKKGSTLPYFCLSIRDPHREALLNSELVAFSFKTKTGLRIDVSKGMRLDSNRIESLSHSYELLSAVSLGWFSSLNEKFKRSDVKEHSEALAYLFFLCHSVHMRTGGLLDNLRYMFMDVTAEKSNFQLFMQDSGKIALKNHLQVALYSKIKETLPEYSIAAGKIERKEAKFIVGDTVNIDWGSLGVTKVNVPSLISNYRFNSFMAATNEIVGLFFAIPKDLHGEFHRQVKLESTPFEWELKLKNKKGNKLLDESGVLKAILNGGAEQQEVDLKTVYSCARKIDEAFLNPRKSEVLKKLSELRLQDNIMTHRQFTSSKSCIKNVTDDGYAMRDKVLMVFVNMIEEEYGGTPPKLWKFVIDCLLSEEPFRFVISPKGQRTMKDREIYIGNNMSFALRLVEKVFSVICQYLPNESIHEAGDRKFLTIQKNFKSALDWSREIARFNSLLHQSRQMYEEKKKESISKEDNGRESTEKEFSDKGMNNWADQVDRAEQLDLLRQHKRAKLQERAEKPNRDLSNITMKERKIIESLEATIMGNTEEVSELQPFEKVSLLQDIRWETNVCFLNGDRTKWSASDLCSKFIVFLDGLKTIPETIRTLCKAVLMKHNEKVMHISKNLHEKILVDDRMNTIKEVCGTRPYAKISENWFQGMLNYTSSALHAAMQHCSFNLLRNNILKNVPIHMAGLCHSDDEIGFLGYGSVDFNHSLVKPQLNIFEQNPLETMLYFHNVMGSLCSINYSKKKTNVHLKVSEFLSLYLIWGDQQFPYMKHLTTAISGLPGTGLDDDIYSCLSQVMTAAARGCPMSILQAVVMLAQERVDKLYSIGRKMHNDVEEIFKLPREYLPLELGGKFSAGVMPLLAAGPAVHDVLILKQALEGTLSSPLVNHRVLKCFYAISPEGMLKTVPDEDPLAQEEEYNMTKFSGFTGMIFKNYLPKRRDDLLEKHMHCEIGEKCELEFMFRRPAASVLKPHDPEDTMKYWHMIMQKPAWIRAVRKDGSRGMAIKRAQWVKGEHVKLKYNEEWRTMRECLEEVADWVNDENIFLTSVEKGILRDYVENVSSSIVATLNYLNKVNVTISSEGQPKGTRTARQLDRPATLQDIRNDVRKIIAYVWDESSFIKENYSFKFAEDLPYDVAKVKQFYKPSFLRSPVGRIDKRVLKCYNSVKRRLKLGHSWEVAFNLSRNMHLHDGDEPHWEAFVHKVYAESAWVYKQFQDKTRTRIVITAASHTEFSTLETLIMENCLKHRTLHITAGVPLARYHPTFNRVVDASSHEAATTIQTMAYVYRSLLKLGMSVDQVAELFRRLKLDNKFLQEHLRDCENFCINGTLDIRLMKMVAVMAMHVNCSSNLANIMMASCQMPLSCWIKPQTKLMGQWTGSFELCCWVGESTLVVRGTDSADFYNQHWKLTCRDATIGGVLLRKAYKEVFYSNRTQNMAPDYHEMSKLKPEICQQASQNLKLVKIGNTWLIKQPGPGQLYLPQVQVDVNSSFLDSNIEDKIVGDKKFGLSLFQRVSKTGRPIRIMSIQYTRVNDHRITDIKYPGHRDFIFQNVNIKKVVRGDAFSDFLNNTLHSCGLERLAEFIKPPEMDYRDVKIMWENFNDSYRKMPEAPIDIDYDEAFPPIEETIDLSKFAAMEMEDIWNTFDDEGSIASEDAFGEIVTQTELEGEGVWDRFAYMDANEKAEVIARITRRRAMTAEDFFNPDMESADRAEMYAEFGSDSGSSGDSRFSTVDIDAENQSLDLSSKIITRCFNFNSSNCPKWIEVAHFIHVKTHSRMYDVEINPKNRLFSVYCLKIMFDNMNKINHFSPHMDDMDDSEQENVYIEIATRKRELNEYFEDYQDPRRTMLVWYDLTYRATDTMSSVPVRKKRSRTALK